MAEYKLNLTAAEIEARLNTMPEKGDPGPKGDPGAPGNDGYTPVRGTDYWTEADKKDIVSDVLEYFGAMPVVGKVDDNNHITLSASLPIGTYTLKYEGTDGLFSDIVDLTITDTDKETYTNVLPLAMKYDKNNPTDESVYIDPTYGSVGFGTNKRISTSADTKTYMADVTGVYTTALIPAKRGDILRFKNCNLKVNPSNTNYSTYLYGFNSEKAYIQTCNAKSDNIANRLPIVIQGDEIVQITLEPKAAWTNSGIDNMAYIMIGTDGLDETSIITVNQEIVD